MNQALRALIIEDSEDETYFLLRRLRAGGYEVMHARVDTGEGMRAALERQPWDVIISDHVMPYFNAPAALKLLQDTGLDIPFIIVSGEISQSVAVNALKSGAHDYIRKDDMVRLLPAIERELREAEMRRERRQAEAALQESEAKFRALVETAFAAIFIYQGDRLLYVNPGAAALTGYTLAELQNRSFWDLIHPQYQPKVHDLARQRQAGSTAPLRYETAILTKSGETRWLDMSSGPIQFDDQPAIISVAFDITERKLAELEQEHLLTEARAAYDRLMQTARQMVQALDTAGVPNDFGKILSETSP